MAIAILYREELREYDFGEMHPFRGDRYERFPKFLREHLPEDDNYRIIKADSATDKDLLLICRQEYIDFTREFYKAANAGLTHSGNFYKFHSADNRPPGRPGKLEEAARLVVGEAKKAVDLLQKGEYEKAVVIGGGQHHAKPNYGEGFCLYNDNAFLARYAMETYKLERIIILDTDAHAGNGTCEYFYDDPRVLFIDLHQQGIYPGTGYIQEIGSGKGRGFTVNCPLLSGTAWDSYQYIFDQVIFPLTEEFKPQLVVRNGGTDPYWGDQLTSLGLSIADFTKLGENFRQMAESSNGKAINMISSGYNEKILPYGWLAIICGTAGIDIPIDEPESLPERLRNDPRYEDTKRMVEEVKRNLKEYWKCFN